VRIGRVVVPIAVATLAGNLLAGCAATATAVGERKLDVQTRMSDTIFLEPPPAGTERTVYVEVRNTSDKPDLDIAPLVREGVAARGLRVVDDPAAARYLLQANVLQAGRSARTAADLAYRKGFGSPITGGIIGGAAGYGAGALGANDTAAVIGGALAGAAIATVADAFVQRVDYSVVTDVQLSERAPAGLVVTETEQAGTGQGSGATRTQTSSRSTEWRRYRTRVVSTAERTNLDWPEAAPELVAGLSRSLAGLF
jgi:Enterobacterial TraT complement resistance protein